MPPPPSHYRYFKLFVRQLGVFTTNHSKIYEGYIHFWCSIFIDPPRKISKIHHWLYIWMYTYKYYLSTRALYFTMKFTCNEFNLQPYLQRPIDCIYPISYLPTFILYSFNFYFVNNILYCEWIWIWFSIR